MVQKQPPEALLVASFSSLRLDAREYRVQEQRALQGLIRLVVLVYAAGFLVDLPGSGSDGPLPSLPADAFVLVFALGVPGIIGTGTLVWLDTVLGRQFAINRLHHLTTQFSDTVWPESVFDARRAGTFPAPRAVHSTVAGLLVLPGSAIGSILLTLIRVREAGFGFSGWMWFGFIFGMATVVTFTWYVTARIWQLRHTSPNYQHGIYGPAGSSTSRAVLGRLRDPDQGESH